MTFNWRRAVMRGTVATVAALLLASLVGSFQGASAQGPPARLYGSATVDGVAASAGANISASIGGVVCGQTTVEADGTYVLDVVASGPAEFEPSARPGCGTEGATIDLTVDGCDAGTATWSGGAFLAQDLAAVCAVPTAVPPTEVPPTVAPPTEVPPTEVIVVTPFGSGGDLGGGSGTTWWALAAGGAVLALAGSAGWMAYRRTVR
jgi:hypothetical protein